jgi:NDP-sugar pyrophosphorylase family protein
VSKGDELAVIFAAGFGETARRDHAYVPKIMLPLGSKPFLEHQLEWLRGAGFYSAIICLGYKAEAVRSYFGDGSGMGMRLQYHVDEKPLGSAGAVKTLGAASLPDDLLVLSGELFVGNDGSRLMDFHRGHEGLATVVVRPPKFAHDGYVAVGPSRRIEEFVTSPRLAKRPMAPTGLWVVRRKLLRYVPEEGPSDFLKDVFPAAVKAGADLFAYPETGPLCDLRTPARYEKFAKEWAKSRG